jgi:hypothetical protein
MTIAHPASIDRTQCSAPRHGTASAYTGYGCRCLDAVLLGSLYRLRLNHDDHRELVNALPTRRRLHSLNATGWGMVQLAEPLGQTCRQAANRIGRAGLVRRTTAERVAHVFDHLRAVPGPSGKARSHAHRAGYIPAYAWTTAAINTLGPEGDIAALLNWLPKPDAPTCEHGPLAQLFDRLDTLTSEHRVQVLRRASSLRAAGTTTAPVVTGARMWDRERYRARREAAANLTWPGAA